MKVKNFLFLFLLFVMYIVSISRSMSQILFLSDFEGVPSKDRVSRLLPCQSKVVRQTAFQGEEGGRSMKGEGVRY